MIKLLMWWRKGLMNRKADPGSEGLGGPPLDGDEGASDEGAQSRQTRGLTAPSS